MKSTRRATPIAVFAALVSLHAAVSAEGPQPNVSLAGLTVGRLVVTSAADTMEETALRETAESRLAKAGIAIDGFSAPVLFLNVSAEHVTAESRWCACAVYHVMLALQEPVTTERVPGEVASAVTWMRSGTVKVAGGRIPRASIGDVVQDVLSFFVRAVKADTQKSDK